MLAQAEESKGFSVEKTFNDDIVSVEQVLPILLEQCDIVATRMRRKGKKCSCISVTFRTLDFKNRSHQTSLSSATDVTDEIYENARRLFLEFWKGQPLRLIGVALTGLTDESFEQMSLFEDTKKRAAPEAGCCFGCHPHEVWQRQDHPRQHYEQQHRHGTESKSADGE